MFNFKGITHVIKNPAGSYSLVGSVPVELMEKRKPTTSDIMGGRVQKDGFAYVGKPYASVEEIREAIGKVEGAKLCATAGCACRTILG